MRSEKVNINQMLLDNSAVYRAADSANQGPACLASSVRELDQFLDGGLRFGELSEWGAPLGRGGKVKNRRALETDWETSGDQKQLLIGTVRGKRSHSFAIDIKEITAE